MTAQQQPIHPGLEALADGFCMVDPEFRVTYWNVAAERLFGLPRSDALGRPLWEVVPGWRERDLRAGLREVMRDGEPLRLSIISAAELLPRNLSVHVVPIEAGGAALHFRDSTIEQRLTDEYSQLLESIRDGFVGVDAEWRIVYVNRAAQVLLSMRRERALGQDLRRLLPASPAYVREAIEATMVDREPRHLAAVRPEGRVFRERAFDVWTYALPDGGVSILFEDVTERLEHEVALARLAAEAEEANLAKSRFFAAVSHELRTPLHAIVGYTHLLGTETYGAMPEGALRAAERASVCAEHLSGLIDDVLLLTTTEVERIQVSPSPLALASFVPTVLEPLRRQAEAKGLRFGIEVPDGLPVVAADPERLRQVLAALVTNAVKFTSRGEIRVRVDLNGSVADQPVVQVRVIDTGPGVPEQERGRIFEAFEQLGEEARTDSVRRGTGMGLTVARQVVTLMGGSLEVGGEAGEGAEFVLRLPVTYAADPA